MNNDEQKSIYTYNICRHIFLKHGTCWNASTLYVDLITYYVIIVYNYILSVLKTTPCPHY